MAKKDKKSAEQKARVAAKQSKKAAQKEKKGKGNPTDDSDNEDVDLESVLEEYAEQQKQFLKVTESKCDPPSSRTSGSFIGSPTSSKELLLFGGEFYDGATASFYNDLFIYNVTKDEWRKVTSPNSPLPRSGHAWCRGGNAGGIYLFGGEYTAGSADENFIILFGGFQDTSQQTKYLQDLWIYDCQNFIWQNPVLPSAAQKPDARSSFSLHPHDSGAVLYGGYSRVKSNVASGKQGKGGSQASKSMLRPTVHEDSWFLRITIAANDATLAPPQVRWERRKKSANSPNPSRAGVTQVFHKGRGLMFGGVHDVEESEEGIDSEFFDQLFAWNIERNRFFQLNLRRARAAPRKAIEDRNRRGRGKADEAELLRNLASLEQNGTIVNVDDMDLDVSEDEETLTREPKPLLNSMPHRRFNAHLAVQGDMLYILGGTFEQGDREYTFDEMHAIDLGKLDGVQEIFKRDIENWQGEDEVDESDSEEDDESEDEDMEGGVAAGVAISNKETVVDTKVEVPPVHLMDNNEEELVEPVIPDSRPHPRPFESLRDFFARTSSAWQDMVLEKLRQINDTAHPSIKEIRKTAFQMADTRWWDSREEISAEEERQEEAGIGEIVSLEDRTRETAGTGRRR